YRRHPDEVRPAAGASLKTFEPVSPWHLPYDGPTSETLACTSPTRSLESVVSYPHPGGSMAAVAEKVKQIIVEQLGVDENQVDNSASFVDDLGADSLDIVELVMAFEEAFELEIPDEDAEKIATVKDAIDYIEAKTSKK